MKIRIERKGTIGGQAPPAKKINNLILSFSLSHMFFESIIFTRKNSTLCITSPAPKARENYLPVFPNLKLVPFGADRLRSRKIF